MSTRTNTEQKSCYEYHHRAGGKNSYTQVAFRFFGFIPLSIEYSVTDSITGEAVGSIVHESRQRITRDDWTLISGGKRLAEVRSTYFAQYCLAENVRDRGTGWKGRGQTKTAQRYRYLQVHDEDREQVHGHEASRSSRRGYRRSEGFVLGDYDR